MDTMALITRTGELLTEAGWTLADGLSMTVGGIKAPVYEKAFETACGTQTAFAYGRASADGTAFYFEGSYFSEGGNVLAACSAYSFINDVTLQHVDAEVALRDCVQKAEAAIDASYARRLFLKHGIKTKA